MGKRIKGAEFRKIFDMIEENKPDLYIMLDTGFSIDTIKRVRRAKEYIDADDFEGLRTAYIDQQITGSIFFLAADIINDKPKPEPVQMELENYCGTLESFNNEKIESLLEQLVRSQWAIVEMLKRIGENLD